MTEQEVVPARLSLALERDIASLGSELWFLSHFTNVKKTGLKRRK